MSVYTKSKNLKPIKKTDKELWEIIEQNIANKRYIILPHAKQRQVDRAITDIDILDILENKQNRKRTRNKRKDLHIEEKSDWNYCIEGKDLDEESEIRIIITFDRQQNLLIVTVIRLIRGEQL